MHGFRKWNLYRNRETFLEACTSVIPDSLESRCEQLSILDTNQSDEICGGETARLDCPWKSQLQVGPQTHLRSLQTQVHVLRQGEGNQMQSWHPLHQKTTSHSELIFFFFLFQTIESMDQLFEVSFSTLAESGKPMSRYELALPRVPLPRNKVYMHKSDVLYKWLKNLWSLVFH